MEEITRTKVVGSTFQGEEVQTTLSTLRQGDWLDLIWEPANEADNSAIGVYAGNQKLGYLPRANRFVDDGTVLDKDEGQQRIHDIKFGDEEGPLPEQIKLNELVLGMMTSGKDIRAQVLQITGGTDEKENYGCNIRLVEDD